MEEKSKKSIRKSGRGQEVSVELKEEQMENVAGGSRLSLPSDYFKREKERSALRSQGKSWEEIDKICPALPRQGSPSGKYGPGYGESY